MMIHLKLIVRLETEVFSQPMFRHMCFNPLSKPSDGLKIYKFYILFFNKKENNKIER